jgi:hypothetical protein
MTPARLVRFLLAAWACWGFGSAITGAVSGAFAPLPDGEVLS